jgi:hypothetical protein
LIGDLLDDGDLFHDVSIASTDSATALPLSSIAMAPLSAVCSICRLLSAFCVMKGFISSRLDDVRVPSMRPGVDGGF